MDICVYLGGYNLEGENEGTVGLGGGRHAWVQTVRHDTISQGEYFIKRTLIHELGHIFEADHDEAYVWKTILGIDQATVMDGAYHGSFDVAVNKTYTSTAFQMSTAELARLCQPGQELYGLQFSNDGKVMILGGGEPLIIGNTMIGALGVSGASAEEDSALAAFGAAALKEVITCL